MPLDLEMIKEIRKPFPKESVQVKKSFKNPETGEQTYLTGYKPQYIIERLNDSFGHEGWDFEVKEHGFRDKTDAKNFTSEIWVLGQLTIYVVKFDENAIDGPILRKVMTVKQQFGFGTHNKNMSLGDALKGATTNALEKCASLIDIGHEAYKGLLKIPSTHPETKTITQDESKSKLAQLCKKNGIKKPEFKQLIMTVFNEEKDPSQLLPEELDKLSAHLEKNNGPF